MPAGRYVVSCVSDVVGKAAVRAAEPVRQVTTVVSPKDIADAVPVEIVQGSWSESDVNTAARNGADEDAARAQVVDYYTAAVSAIVVSQGRSAYSHDATAVV